MLLQMLCKSKWVGNYSNNEGRLADMIGLFVIGLLGLWVWFVFWAGKVITKLIFKNRNKEVIANATYSLRLAHGLTRALLTFILLLLPFLDQVIAYPKWQQLCATTGDFEWGPGMDEKKAFGREVIAKSEQTKTDIFPNIKVEYSSLSIYDAKTQELIFKKPHYAYSARAFMYLPSGSGNKSAPFLPSCATYGLHGENWQKKLHLTEISEQGK
jgi:hypothetical protein